MQEIEAAVVRHYTSRAGDPHRHLHLQINARVLAEDTWRGLHTVGVRDSLGAINGIGHAAVICDPEFRAALAGRGFTLEAASGEIVELAGFVRPFGARAAQIGRNVERLEATWRSAHPGAEPSPALRRSWDARAWAQTAQTRSSPRTAPTLPGPGSRSWPGSATTTQAPAGSRQRPGSRCGWGPWTVMAPPGMCWFGWGRGARGGTRPMSAGKSNS